eukprot:CAMPEP_0194347386 /NCGR_PEP_ID=MMETSP0171-20130528/105963_1 /TAXON_ID=218684 /ORGANISM="Corethron pennatum, Strain L29A3" /LENGTH=240 /DNA_ID=CAMNT_0039114633 /DNA_START=43 /DNA_END=763 /DNA_ORIENTATION=+
MSWSVMGEGGLRQGNKRGSYPSESGLLSEGALPLPRQRSHRRRRCWHGSSTGAGRTKSRRGQKRPRSFRSFTLSRTATFVTLFRAPTRRRSHRARPVSVSVSPAPLAHAYRLPMLHFVVECDGRRRAASGGQTRELPVRIRPAVRGSIAPPASAPTVVVVGTDPVPGRDLPDPKEAKEVPLVPQFYALAHRDLRHPVPCPHPLPLVPRQIRVDRRQPRPLGARLQTPVEPDVAGEVQQNG